MEDREHRQKGKGNSHMKDFFTYICRSKKAEKFQVGFSSQVKFSF